ncbi:predicted protein [Uncinocarpus reesii 1704]|uniref:Sister chromatid cohesion protein Dcc1 n=1 Tax=Uncinocarpus reesii (strain UAMH 1704) TaxID=336963 RepID=C4JDG6_UNCRE|nr:uncharacterized protein UREG_00379 [Uncinocarpus reesii 1704]EEP75533.1 predicted protein [Uncinocarpus reesii 1704]
MATSLPFTHATPQETFRLLELPEELLAYLASEEPPAYGTLLPRLYLKSPPPRPSAGLPSSGSSSNQGADDAFVNICTDKKTYSLRQVHSSNSIFILKPQSLLRRHNEEDVVLGNNASSGVAAISLCKSTLELQKFGDEYSAVPFLLRSLQVYDAMDIEEDAMEIDARHLSDIDASIEGRNKAITRLLEDVPLSATECCQAWVDMCGFIDGDKSTGNLIGWRPLAAAKLSVWKKMLEGSVLQGINLDKQFLVRDLWNATIDDTETLDGRTPFPKDLFDAIVRRLVDYSPSEVGLHVFSELKCKVTLESVRGKG